MEYLNILFKTLFFYILIIIIYRLMGKREIGQLGIVDLIVSILIAELVAIGIDSQEQNLLLVVFPISILVLIQVVMSFISLKNPKIRSILDGDPSVIINKGKINFKEMIKQRYNIDDLLTQLREKHIRGIDEVDYAILETSGRLSVFKKNTEASGNFPLPVILDGKIDKKVLKLMNKDKSWVYSIINDRNINLENIFYAFYAKGTLFIIEQKK